MHYCSYPNEWLAFPHYCPYPTARDIRSHVTGGVEKSEARSYPPNIKNHNFLPFLPIKRFLYLLGGNKKTKQGLRFFWRSLTTPTIFFGSWLTLHSHNLGLKPCKSRFLICCFLTWKSNLDILTKCDCHKILGGGD